MAVCLTDACLKNQNLGRKLGRRWREPSSAEPKLTRAVRVTHYVEKQVFCWGCDEMLFVFCECLWMLRNFMFHDQKSCLGRVKANDVDSTSGHDLEKTTLALCYSDNNKTELDVDF